MNSEFMGFICMLADTAGQIAARNFRTGLELTPKSDSSPVSHIDLEIEKKVIDLITKNYPDHGILGEEFGITEGKSPFEWVIDPIDGTSSFIAGKPLFTTLISLLFEGKPILGIIDQPITKERWIGEIGRPTLFNSKLCRLLSEENISKDNPFLRLGCTTPFMFKPDEYIVFQKVAKIADSLSFGGDAYNYGLLTLGHLDIVIEADLKYYDVAALIPIIEGAGCLITNWKGNPISKNSFDGKVLATNNRVLHKRILNVVLDQTEAKQIIE